MKSDTTGYFGLIVLCLYREVIALIYGYQGNASITQWQLIAWVAVQQDLGEESNIHQTHALIPFRVSVDVTKLMNAMSCESAKILITLYPLNTGCYCFLFCFSFQFDGKLNRRISKLFLFSVINPGQIWARKLFHDIIWMQVICISNPTFCSLLKSF